ncbi:SGNH hydrolase-type esterase domain-containing protein [Leptodontidium sp. 2 PMI_412]|nr:SGNH hydrolase-type esterase domain-containing protein [Leptodontidium sp. 2 PMI_412]
MRHGLYSFAGLTVLQASVVQALPWSIRSLFGRQSSDQGTDVTDLTFIRKWAAIGDSYAAGIGAGSKLSDSGSCGRYDNSYPMMLQRYDQMPDPAPTMEFLACSGATTPEVLSKQVSRLGTGYDLITLSTGGNDVGLVNILNQCIYQWNSNNGNGGCDNQLTESERLIKDVLPGNFDKITAELKNKVGSDRRIYWTGYANFFDDSTTDCDGVSWAFFFNLERKQFLTQARRKRMNDLVNAVNDQIKAAAARGGDQFVFVDYNQYFIQTQGRFCEGSTKEPDGGRDGLLFFEWDTDNGPTTLTRRGGIPGFDDVLPGDFIDIDKRQANSTPPGDSPGFDEQVFSLLQAGRAANNSLVISLPDNSAADPAFRGRTTLSINDLIFDTILRVFHPQPAGHAIITSLLVWHISDQQAKALNVTWGPEKGGDGSLACALS